MNHPSAEWSTMTRISMWYATGYATLFYTIQVPTLTFCYLVNIINSLIERGQCVCDSGCTITVFWWSDESSRVGVLWTTTLYVQQNDNFCYYILILLILYYILVLRSFSPVSVNCNKRSSSTAAEGRGGRTTDPV